MFIYTYIEYTQHYIVCNHIYRYIYITVLCDIPISEQLISDSKVLNSDSKITYVL